jgi:hypothetical protein
VQQHPINQRISFLLDSFGLSARAFSEEIGEKPTITQNYVGSRNSMPSADYLERVLKHFESINSKWLLTGEGDPFLTENANLPTFNRSTEKKSGKTQASSGGSNVKISSLLNDCEIERDSLRSKLNLAEKEIALLHAQLEMKDVVIAAKAETIELLRTTLNSTK